MIVPRSRRSIRPCDRTEAPINVAARNEPDTPYRLFIVHGPSPHQPIATVVRRRFCNLIILITRRLWDPQKLS
jgi:hypothetical protein